MSLRSTITPSSGVVTVVVKDASFPVVALFPDRILSDSLMQPFIEGEGSSSEPEGGVDVTSPMSLPYDMMRER